MTIGKDPLKCSVLQGQCRNGGRKIWASAKERASAATGLSLSNRYVSLGTLRGGTEHTRQEVTVWLIFTRGETPSALEGFTGPARLSSYVRVN